MKALKTLLVPAILLVASTAALACDYGCYNTCYTPSYSSYYSYQPTCSYSSWSYNQDRGYYYCTCSFRTSAYGGWNKYICVYNRGYSNYVYFYNPTSHQYWGRYDIAAKGFSVLPGEARGASIAELPNDSFPAAVAQTAIPDSQVGEQLATPPAPPADAVAALPAS